MCETYCKLWHHVAAQPAHFGWHGKPHIQSVLLDKETTLDIGFALLSWLAAELHGVEDHHYYTETRVKRTFAKTKTIQGYYCRKWNGFNSGKGIFFYVKDPLARVLYLLLTVLRTYIPFKVQ